MQRIILPLVCLLLTPGCGSDSLSPADLQLVIEESQACEPGDTCVLAGSSRCTCAVPVNAEHKERVDKAAAEIDCQGATVRCTAQENLRCENGKCTADSP
jgi:hypothetical protein